MVGFQGADLLLLFPALIHDELPILLKLQMHPIQDCVQPALTYRAMMAATIPILHASIYSAPRRAATAANFFSAPDSPLRFAMGVNRSASTYVLLVEAASERLMPASTSSAVAITVRSASEPYRSRDRSFFGAGGFPTADGWLSASLLPENVQSLLGDRIEL